MGEATVTFKITGTGSKVDMVPDVEIPASETIRGVKKMIESHLGVPVGRQILTFNHNQLLLNDRRIDSYADFGESATLQLMVPPLAGDNVKFIIHAKFVDKEGVYGDRQADVLVEEQMTVSGLKMELMLAWEIPSWDMTLYRCSIQMETHRPLSDYYVCLHSEIQVKNYVPLRVGN